MKRAVPIFVILLMFGGLLIAPATADEHEPLYNTTDEPMNTSWMANVDEVNISTIGLVFSRIGTFMIGESPENPTAGPIFTGALIGGLVIVSIGTSRPGIVGGGVVAVITSAVLSQTSGVAPTWVYPIVVFMLAILAGAIYIRTYR